MSSTDFLLSADEQQNRCIELTVAKLRRYGAIELTGQALVVPVTFREDDASGTEASCVKTMQVEEIEYLDEGSFALRVTEALPERGRLTKKAAAELRARTEQRIVIRRDCAAQLPRIDPADLDRIRAAAEAFDIR